MGISPIYLSHLGCFLKILSIAHLLVSAAQYVPNNPRPPIFATPMNFMFLNDFLESAHLRSLGRILLPDRTCQRCSSRVNQNQFPPPQHRRENHPRLNRIRGFAVSNHFASNTLVIRGRPFVGFVRMVNRPAKPVNRRNNLGHSEKRYNFFRLGSGGTVCGNSHLKCS